MPEKKVTPPKEVYDRIRRENKELISKIFEKIPGTRIINEKESAETSWFGVPIVCSDIDPKFNKKNLVKFLEDNGFDIIMTREPGGSVGGEEIRNLLLQGEVDRWSAETEILLFTAARRDHLERIILPALQGGKIVICDRFTDSTRMYQGMRGPKLRDLVDKLTINYNRSRQASITKELIEIISGAESL